MNTLRFKFFDYLKLLRIWQWLKNLFIILPLLLSKSFFGDLIIDSIKLFLLFSLFVSSNYIFNDIRDRDIDKYHPEKKYRGVASGNIKVVNAKILALLLLITSMSLTYISFKIEISYFYLLYISLAYLYTRFLKYINFIDALCIASFFLIRLTIGGIIGEIQITSYLYIFTFFMSIFIVYLKKNSIINKNFMEKNIFYETLIVQNSKYQFRFLLIFFGIMSNIAFIVWGSTISDILNTFELIVLLLCFVSFMFFTYFLFKESNKGKLEDFVIGVLSNKMVFFNACLLILLFVYIYF